MSQTHGETLLRIEDLTVEYPVRGWRRRSFRALRDVSLDIRSGETLGLVGESASGKTTLGRAVLGLAPVSSGSIVFDGREISGLTPKQRRMNGLGIQVVFQDPYTSLNPAMTIEEILAEPLIARGVQSRGEARKRVQGLLDQVHLPSDAAGRRPREFSGGQRQRIAIARALALFPRLIVCDEPVSALDLSTRSRMLELFDEIQRETGVSYLFISHDLSVIRHISHRVAVIAGGEIVEIGDSAAVTTKPTHPHTRRLLLAAPIADPIRQRERREQRRAILRADKP